MTGAEIVLSLSLMICMSAGFVICFEWYIGRIKCYFGFHKFREEMLDANIEEIIEKGIFKYQCTRCQICCFKALE